MPIPTQSEMYREALGFMLDGETRTLKQIRVRALQMLNMTAAEASEKTSSGAQVWDSRVGWAVQFLQRAELLKRVARGTYVITEEGRRVYEDGIDGHDMQHHLDRLIAERNPWNIGADSKKKDEMLSEAISEISPEEAIAQMEDELNASLESQLIDLIMEREPDFFEKVVVQLLEKMGYGTGRVTQYTGDGGIDGLVTTDELGFRPIMTQAKRYKPGHSVGRPEVQSFVGALNGAANGVFITTSHFTKEAIEYAEGYPNATLALIDGKRLTELMIKYDLGVSTIRTVCIKRIDSDYFEG